MESTMVDYECGGVLRTRTGSILPGVAPSNVYTCADGADIVIAANADAVFRRLSQAMGRDELARDPRFAGHASRGENAAELDAQIQAWCQGLESTALLKVLAANGVPAGKTYTAPDMISDVHYLARDMVLRPDGPSGPLGPMAGIVPKFVGTPAELRGTGPALGRDTRAVLRDLAGLDDQRISDLLRRGLIREPA
jgi:formyl-CoA transferase/succinyl-CoA--D-citramalate CoA-transferase